MSDRCKHGFVRWDPDDDPDGDEPMDYTPIVGARELIEALDAACLGHKPERSLRIAGNKGIPPTYVNGDSSYFPGFTTHVAGDLCGLADVIERYRAALKPPMTEQRPEGQ